VKLTNAMKPIEKEEYSEEDQKFFSVPMQNVETPVLPSSPSVSPSRHSHSDCNSPAMNPPTQPIWHTSPPRTPRSSSSEWQQQYREAQRGALAESPHGASPIGEEPDEVDVNGLMKLSRARSVVPLPVDAVASISMKGSCNNIEDTMMRLMGSPDLDHVANSPRLAGSIDEVSRRIKDIGAASLPTRPHSAIPQASPGAPGSGERTPRKSGGDVWTYNSARVTRLELAGVPGPPQSPRDQLRNTPQPPRQSHGPSPSSAPHSRPGTAPGANQRDPATPETPKQGKHSNGKHSEYNKCQGKK
ncbi:hypothetical protein CYMTET_30758, partial [Cymbomonas tetramitiformis]